MVKNRKGALSVICDSAHEKLATPKVMVNRYLAESDEDDVMKYLLRSNDQIKGMVYRLAEYLTELTPSPARDGKCLFNHCLDMAHSEWSFGIEITLDPAKHIAYFVMGLLEPVTHLQMITVSCPRTHQVWDPTDKTLRNWIRETNSFPLIEQRVPGRYWENLYPIDFKMLVASRFIIRKAEELSQISPHLDMIIRR